MCFRVRVLARANPLTHVTQSMKSLDHATASAGSGGDAVAPGAEEPALDRAVQITRDGSFALVRVPLCSISKFRPHPNNTFHIAAILRCCAISGTSAGLIPWGRHGSVSPHAVPVHADSSARAPCLVHLCGCFPTCFNPSIESLIPRQ